MIYKTRNSASDEELKTADRALKELKGTVCDRFYYNIPQQDLDYCIVSILKTGQTPQAYPRKPGMPEKKPL